MAASHAGPSAAGAPVARHRDARERVRRGRWVGTADYNIPLIVVRVISDAADEDAHTSAIGFVNQHAGDYSLAILREYISLLNTLS